MSERIGSLGRGNRSSGPPPPDDNSAVGERPEIHGSAGGSSDSVCQMPKDEGRSTANWGWKPVPLASIRVLPWQGFGGQFMPGSSAPRGEPAVDGLPLSDRKSRSLSFQSEFCKCSHGDTGVRTEIHKHLAQTVGESRRSISDSPLDATTDCPTTRRRGAGDRRPSGIHRTERRGK